MSHHSSHHDQAGSSNNDVNKSSYISIPIERTRHSIAMRRSSFLNNPIGSFKGPNSLSRFASSYSRAQSFRTIEPITSTSRSYFRDGDDALFDRDTLAPSFNGQRVSTVVQRSDFDFLHKKSSQADFDYYSGDYSAILDDASIQQSISSYGAVPNLDLSYHEFQETNPLILKKVESKGKLVTVIAGQSTAPQTVFNSVNVLIGIGLLALPLGLRHAGWLIGIPVLTLCALLTFHSAELLSRCMDTDPTLMTYSDLAFVSFGPRGRALISFLFSLDLLGNGVSLIILFADSLNALFPSISINHFKFIAFLALTPPSFLPLNILSLVSLLGISSTLTVVGAVFISGLIKKDAPGSLIEVSTTYMLPQSLGDVFIAIGILMAPFGGHSIFPNLKVDMRHPHKFTHCLKVTYLITFLTDVSMASIGFLMFGSNVKEEVTKSVLTTPGYPKWTYLVICGLMSLVPFSKTPLNASPIISIFELMFKVGDISSLKGFTYSQGLTLKVLIRVGVNAAFVIVSIIIPDFDKIISFLGAGLCFLLCLILPSLFYIKICHKTITRKEKIGCWTIIIISSILSIIGTTAAVIY